MDLKDLTDRTAVEAAIAEFDSLGREGFLAKYGYKKARRYFLLHEGRWYDSKAIAGVALGHQYPQSGALRAEDFSGGEATVEGKLRSLGFDFEVLPAEVRNPDWTRDETVLALDLYIRRRPQLPDQNDDDIIVLSDLLGALARQNGIAGNDRFRNPNGVSMKIANLSRLEEGDKRKGLQHGSGTELVVWNEFIGNAARLHVEAERIRASVGQSGLSGFISVESNFPASESVKVSRGPAPSFGEIAYTRTDGENLVYVMRLAGDVDHAFSKRQVAGLAVIKVGRTNDLARRLGEMNCGFPPGIDLEWRLVSSLAFPGADQAHSAEQTLLRKLEKQGFALGREFSAVSEDVLEHLLK